MTELKHPDRFRILVACDAAPTSPTTHNKARLGGIAYHFRDLADDGFIRPTRRVARRGATETYYTATAKGRKLLRRLDLNEDASA